MNAVDHLLVQEMQSEDHMGEMLYDDTDGELIDAVMDGQTNSIFSDPEDNESEDEDDE